MKATHLLATAFILGCTSIAWFILGSAMHARSQDSGATLGKEVSDVWGPPLVQKHPEAFYLSPNAPGGKARLQPRTSNVHVQLHSDPKQRGLIWHRTYGLSFEASYTLANPTRVPQTLYVHFPLPDQAGALRDFVFDLAGAEAPAAGSESSQSVMTRAVRVPAGGEVALRIGYRTLGTDTWRYEFGSAPRVRGFTLVMDTDFADINFPVGTGSPRGEDRVRQGDGWSLTWNYPDVISAPAIGMDMPKLLNAGPVASRMAFFAPVSLLFFFTVVLLVGGIRGIALHPMHVFFASAGFFAFHLLFAYLVDLLPLYPSFIVAALVSLALVGGYLRAVGGKELFKVALPAQLAYMVLFSLSFFFDGLTGITITVGAIVTLAILMVLTARVDWNRVFGGNGRTPNKGKPSSAATPPPLPTQPKPAAS